MRQVRWALEADLTRRRDFEKANEGKRREINRLEKSDPDEPQDHRTKRGGASRDFWNEQEKLTVTRGGSYGMGGPHNSLSARRNKAPADRVWCVDGFRIVLEMTDSKEPAH